MRSIALTPRSRSLAGAAATAEQTKHLSRRHFLFTVGAGGVVTAAAIAAKIPAPPRPPLSGQGKRATRGYEATAHVNRYYRTAKV